MMVLVAVDMEGITGVTNWDQVTPGHAEYARFRRIMTGDVNAAVRGAFDGGFEEVVVTDGHWNGANILVEELDPRAKLNSGTASPYSMMQGIDQGADAVVFIGYHARHGSAMAVLDHTWSSLCVQNLWVNDQIAGEYTINAALAGHFDVPVLLVSGDQTACAQVADLLPGVSTVVVKRASSRFSAECLPPVAVVEMIEQATKASTQHLRRNQAPKPLVLAAPIRIAVEFKASDMADRAATMPGTNRDQLKVSLVAPNMPAAYTQFEAMVELARRS